MFAMYVPKDFMTLMYISCRYCKNTIPGFCYCFCCETPWCPSCRIHLQEGRHNFKKTIFDENRFRTVLSETLQPVSNHKCARPRIYN
jgi:hypothetical protein